MLKCKGTGFKSLCGLANIIGGEWGSTPKRLKVEMKKFRPFFVGKIWKSLISREFHILSFVPGGNGTKKKC